MQKSVLVIPPYTRMVPIAIAIALVAPPAHADTSAPVRALLADPAQLAAWLRDHDPTARASQAKVEQARALARQAGVYQNPQLSVGVNDIALGIGNQPPPSTDPSVQTGPGPTGLLQTSNLAIGVSELFEIGKRGPRREAAELRTREAIESSVESLGGRLSDATVALGKIAYVVAVRDVARQNLDAARQLEANERIRLEHKDLAGIDFSRIELDTQELEVELTRADADIAVALAACTATLFADCDVEGLDVATLDTAAALPAELDPSRAVVDRPAHQAQRLEASALGQDAVLADHRKIPDPTVGLTYTYDNYNYSGSLPHSIGVSVGIPLPLLDRGNHDAAAARAGARSIELQEDATIRTELGVVQGLRKQFLAVKATLDRYERESLPRSRAIVEQARKAFDLGQTGLAELLLDERVHRDLVHRILDTRFELFNVRAQLRRALGLDDLDARGAGGPR